MQVKGRHMNGEREGEGETKRHPYFTFSISREKSSTTKSTQEIFLHSPIRRKLLEWRIRAKDMRGRGNRNQVSRRRQTEDREKVQVEGTRMKEGERQRETKRHPLIEENETRSHTSRTAADMASRAIASVPQPARAPVKICRNLKKKVARVIMTNTKLNSKGPQKLQRVISEIHSKGAKFTVSDT